METDANEAQLIPSEMVNHIAKEHFNLGFVGQMAMHRRNIGAMTGGLATIALILFLISSIMSFGEYGDLALTSSVSLGVMFLAFTLLLCAQEFVYNQIWKEIKSQVIKLKCLTDLEENEYYNWHILLESSKDKLWKLAMEHSKDQSLLLKIELEELYYLARYCFGNDLNQGFEEFYGERMLELLEKSK